MVSNDVYWGTAKYAKWTFYLAATAKGLCLITLPNESFDVVTRWVARQHPQSALLPAPEHLEPYRLALIAYLDGNDEAAQSLSYDVRGTAFQVAVWGALQDIPWGRTRTYGEVAMKVGRPDAVRAVAHAIGANPLAPLVPCHRVIGKDGKLTGYRGGLEMKAQLLKQEGFFPTNPIQ